jgi:hypothetical protein
MYTECLYYEPTLRTICLASSSIQVNRARIPRQGTFTLDPDLHNHTSTWCSSPTRHGSSNVLLTTRASVPEYSTSKTRKVKKSEKKQGYYGRFLMNCLQLIAHLINEIIFIYFGYKQSLLEFHQIILRPQPA